MKRAIVTEKAPAPIGPYSQGVSANGFLYLSGQLGIDPASGEFPVSAGDQTRQIMENIKAVLNEKDLDFDAIVKTTIFLKDMNDFAEVNKVYGSFLTEPFPARSTVEVSRLPKDGLVEIEVIALLE